MALNVLSYNTVAGSTVNRIFPFSDWWKIPTDGTNIYITIETSNSNFPFQLQKVRQSDMSVQLTMDFSTVPLSFGTYVTPSTAWPNAGVLYVSCIKLNSENQNGVLRLNTSDFSFAGSPEFVAVPGDDGSTDVTGDWYDTAFSSGKHYGIRFRNRDTWYSILDPTTFTFTATTAGGGTLNSIAVGFLEAAGLMDANSTFMVAGNNHSFADSPSTALTKILNSNVNSVAATNSASGVSGFNVNWIFIGADGNIYVGSFDNHIYQVRASDLAILNTIPIAGASLAATVTNTSVFFGVNNAGGAQIYEMTYAGLTPTLSVTLNNGTGNYTSIDSLGYDSVSGLFFAAQVDHTATTPRLVKLSTGTPPSFAPSQPPTPGVAGVGSTVTIYGSHFTGATSVSFNGTSATFTVISDSQIVAVVPNGATSGPVSVQTPGGTTQTSTSVFIIPSLIGPAVFHYS